MAGENRAGQGRREVSYPKVRGRPRTPPGDGLQPDRRTTLLADGTTNRGVRRRLVALLASVYLAAYALGDARARLRPRPRAQGGRVRAGGEPPALDRHPHRRVSFTAEPQLRCEG